VAALAGVRGLGGIGKTALASAAARELEAYFEGRVVWLDAGPNDAYAVQGRMAAALGVALESDDLQVRADVLALAWRRQPPPWSFWTTCAAATWPISRRWPLRALPAPCW
jgi:CO dehydrogenase nickel-insertion accessory protein CooC1